MSATEATLDELRREAEAHHAARRWAEEESVRGRAVALLDGGVGPSDGELVAELRALAAAQRRQGRYAEAVPVLERVVQLVEELEGPTHPSLGLVLDQLAAAISRAHPERQKDVKRLEVRAAHIRARRR